MRAKRGPFPLAIFCCVWIAFGVAAFVQINAWGNEYNRKLALVAAGKVPSTTLYVVSITAGERGDGWGVRMSADRKASPRQAEEFRKVRELGDLAVGSPVTAYRFGPSYFIPRFNKGGFNWGKWVFLAFGLVPPVIALSASAIVYKSRRRRQASTAANAVVPRAFSTDRLNFETLPTDEQLLALLGSGEVPISVTIQESPGELVARPGLLPMKWIMPWMLLIATAITASPWIAGHFHVKFSGPGLWLIVPLVWGAVLPVMFGIFFAINRHFASQKEYLRVDKIHQTLELPRLEVKLAKREIETFTVIDRWYRGIDGWTRIRHLGVLVRRSGGAFELYPILLNSITPLFHKPLAEQLGEIFHVPVRQVKRTLVESKALADAA